MKYFIKCLIIICFLVGCSKNKKNSYDIEMKTFTNTEIIDSIEKINTEILFREPVLYNIDTFLIILDRNNSDQCIHIFNTRTNKHITSTAIRGQGPNEITSPGTITFEPRTSNCFWLSDFGKNKIFKFYIDSILRNPKYKPSINKDIPHGQFFLNYAFLNDSIIIANSLKFTSAKPDESQQMELQGINSLTQNFIDFKYIVPQEIKTKDYFSGYFNFCKTDSVVALAYNFSDMIILQNLNGKIIKRIIGPKGFVKFKDRHKLRTQEVTYSDIIECDGYLFGLYSGEHIKEKNQRVPYNTELRIFSIKGEYIKTLKFNEKIGNVGIDLFNKRIYGYSPTSEKLFFCNYKL